MGIKFIKVLRICDHNRRTASDCARDGVPASGLIYDFYVEVDGVVRAIFVKRMTGRGYVLADREGEEIRVPFDVARPWSGYTLDAEAQGAFYRVYSQAVDDGRVPSRADLVARRNERAAVQAKLDEAAADAKRLALVQQAGPELLDCLVEIVAHDPVGAERRARAQAVIDQAMGAV